MRDWSFDLLDEKDQVIGALEGVTGGGCEIVAQSPLGGSASIEIADTGQAIDWMKHRVRATFHKDGKSWPVGVWLFSSPSEKHSDTGKSYSVGLLSKMSIPAEDSVEERHSIAKGAAIIPAAVALLLSTGEQRIAVTDSPAVMASALTWDAGTSKLTIINDLLTAAGYWGLWCDGSGQFRVEPYVNPADRESAYTFEHGEASIHYPDWSRSQDLSKVPNRFIAVGQGDEDTAPLVGVATNEDPSSPFSFQARGRWITATDEGVEASSQAVINQIAQRRLRDQMSPVSRLEVRHDMIELDPNDLVTFIAEDGVTRRATVQRMSIDFTYETDISAEWREV